MKTSQEWTSEYQKNMQRPEELIKAVRQEFADEVVAKLCKQIIGYSDFDDALAKAAHIILVLARESK